MIKTPLSTVIGGAFWTPGATVIGGASKTLNQLIKSLFANNEQGFAYDPNDLTTMFQDAGGTIPVTAAGQAVGLMKDKSGRNNHAFQTVSASRPILQRDTNTGAYYLAFDGVDDSLVTNSIDFTATDKVGLFAGLSKLGSSMGAVVGLGSSANANNGTFELLTDITANSLTLRKRGVGTPAPFTDAVATALPSPIKAVLSSSIDFSTPFVPLRVNGKTTISTANSGVIAASVSAPIYIGRRGGATLPFNGHLYSLIGIGRLTTTAETLALEKSITKNVGVTLSV